MFLGTEVDTAAGELKLLADKLQCLQVVVGEGGDCKVCSCCEFGSPVHLLNHAYKVITSGRSFLWRMLNVLHRLDITALAPLAFSGGSCPLN